MLRPFKVWKHVLGNPVDGSGDELIYHEEDQKFTLGISKSKDKKYIFIASESKQTTEIRFLETSNLNSKFVIFHPREVGVEYEVYSQNDRFLILTNQDNSKNFKLLEVLYSEFVPGTKQNWKERIAYRPHVRILSLITFKNFLIVRERENALVTINVQNLQTGETFKVDFPEPVYALDSTYNENYDSNKLRVMYSSFTTPKTVYDINLDDKSKVVLKEDPVLGNYDRTLYVSSRAFATAPDGQKIPLSIVHKKGVQLNGENPCYLYGYGSYGYTIDPSFSSNRISLLDRGIIAVIAHIRGGGALGRPWYEDGKLLKKKNTFDDFIASAEFLIQEKYTNPSKLVIEGGSAGGLLIGATVNKAPKLFKAAILDVPFVDVVTTMLDPTIPLTVEEYEEWGNPNEKEYFDYMLSYSPYDNIKAQEYPNLLVLAGLNDPRVMYWEPTKYVAKLRATKTGNSTLYFRCYMEEGHMGASGRYDYLHQVAFTYAFILDQLGFTQ